MPDSTTPDPRLLELARQRRLYAIDRADGRVDLLAGRTPNQPAASTAELSPVAIVDGRLDGLALVATNTAGAFLVVDVDDTADEVEAIAEAALRREGQPAETVEALEVAGLGLLADHLASTVAVLGQHVDGLAVTADGSVGAALDDVETAVERLRAVVHALTLVPQPPTGPTIAGGATP